MSGAGLGRGRYDGERMGCGAKRRDGSALPRSSMVERLQVSALPQFLVPNYQWTKLKITTPSL